MAQPSLRFGGLTLCDPSGGLDGYELTQHNLTRPDAVEVSITNTAGRIKVITGKGQTEQTSLVLGFKCQARFSSAASLHSFLQDVEAAATDTRNNLRTVQYGLMDSASTFSEDHMDLEFELEQVWQSEDGWWLDFKVKFTKWGQ